ncbi:MAG TPA: hypothetical protein VFZ65_11860 [Planctomycetota bacterium]|nr:hypothetical protein [Planctomycetota bacterium]
MWPAALLAACAVDSAVHVGPVTAAAAVGQRQFSCSQAGVLESTPAGLRLVADPGWRAFALAGREAQGGLPAVLLVGGGEPAKSGDVALLDVSGRVLARQHVADDLVYGLALAPDAPVAAVACADGRVLLLDLPSLALRRLRWQHAGPAVAVAFAPDGTLLASAGHDGKILLGGAGDDRAPQALLDHTAAVSCLAWSPDALLASGARDGKVRLHDRSGRLLRTWQRLGGAVVAVAFRGRDIACEVAQGPDAPGRAVVLALP